MMARRKGHYGAGSIDPSGEGSWRLRYRIDGVRYTKTVEGTKTDAARELRRLLQAGDDGRHVAPDKMTVGQWIAHWIEIGAPGKRKKKNGGRTIERYAELLDCHVKPVLGEHHLQRLTDADIDSLYAGLEGKISAQTAHHVHTVFNSCLTTAARKKRISVNPIANAEQVPSPKESDHEVLDDDQLRTLVKGFRKSVLFPFVYVLAFTGCRRNEALALRWGDLNAVAKTLRIERALEETKKFGLRLKGPKKDAHKRTITIDDDLIAVLVAEREKHQRIIAGIPDGAAVDLSLIKLPDDALIFPNPPAKGAAWAARCAHDPAVLLRIYAKRTRKADVSAADAIAALSKGVLAG
jgi:integrase